MFLLCHSSNPSGKVTITDGQWGIPKGGCEDGESELEAAIRETLEETGIDVKKYKFSKKPLVTYSTKSKKYVIFYVKIADTEILNMDLDCTTYIADGTRKENDDYVWVSWDKAKEISIKNQKFNLFTDEVLAEIS
jgi:8-oxo-dGTP pyrophosphatase MutT (NUDIX family)